MDSFLGTDVLLFEGKIEWNVFIFFEVSKHSLN